MLLGAGGAEGSKLESALGELPFSWDMEGTHESLQTVSPAQGVGQDSLPGQGVLGKVAPRSWHTHY